MADRPPRCPGCFATRLPDGADSCPVCGFQSEQASQARSSIALPLGAVIRDRYRIGRVLGKPGGFGITYLAFDERLHTRVAIKEYMPREVAGRATSDGSEVWSSGGHEETFQHGLDQFLREARTLAQFDHPNVVGVSNYFETNGTGYLVMDYYEGRTVAQRLGAEADGRMDPETASGIIEEVADGLREVHVEGYLHRDIKPSNIYLAQDGRPILIDFGAARAVLGEHSQNLSVLVTPGYAPYEQYRMRGDPGPHTDIYSCGATLYRMVTGTVPEPASERIVDDKLEPPRTLNPEVPPGLSTVIEEAMAVKGENRPPTAAALQERLQAVTYETKSTQRSGAEKTARPSAEPSRQTDATASSSAPRWARMLLWAFLIALLGLGGWAEHRYDMVGLFPPETESTPPPNADAEGPTPDELPRSIAGGDGNGIESGGSSEPGGGQQEDDPAEGSSGAENNQSSPDGNESSSLGQADPPADIAGRDDETSDEPSRNDGDASGNESSRTAERGSSDPDEYSVSRGLGPTETSKDIIILDGEEEEEGRIYEEDFSDDPGYSTSTRNTNGSAAARWDASQENFYARVADQSADWHSVGLSPSFRTVKPEDGFTISFRFNPVEPNWGHYPGIYFVTSDSDAAPGELDPALLFNIRWSDGTMKKLVLRNSEGTGYKSATIPAEDEWYDVTIEYSPATQTTALTILRKDGSTFVEEQNLSMPVERRFDQIMIGETGSGPAYGDRAQIRLDDIVVAK